MQPRGEYHAARAGGYGRNGVAHVVVEAFVNALLALGDVYFLEIDADLVEHEVLLYPLEALARRLHLGKVIVSALLCTDDTCDHGAQIDLLFVDDRDDPAGGAGIDMRPADLGAAGSHADERCVAAAAVDRRFGCKAELPRRFFAERTDDIGALDDLGQVLGINAVHIAQGLAPAALTRAAVVQEGRIRRIPRHDASAGAAADKIFLYVEPFVYPLIRLRLVFLHPFVLPQGILDARGCSPRPHEALQEHSGVYAGNGDAVGLTLGKLPAGTLIHVAHRAAQRIALFIDQHKPLHLRAEGYADDLLRVNAGFLDEAARAFPHGLPPLVRVLLRSAVGHYIKPVALILAGQKPDRFAELEKAGLNARRSDIIRDNIHFLSSLPIYLILPNLLFSVAQNRLLPCNFRENITPHFL